MASLKDILNDLGSQTKEAQVAEPVEKAPMEKEASLEIPDELLIKQGKLMAQGFVSELKKIAVDTVGITPNPSAVPPNPGVILSKEQTDPQTAAVVGQILSSLTSGQYTTEGVVEQSGQPVAPIGREPDPPVAADLMREEEVQQMYGKQASVIRSLYNKLF